MDSALTRTQFALDALVAAGHVSQAKVDEALALFPAPAGEPEMPEPDSYCTHADSHEYDVWSEASMRAYGDARAEHARRVAMEEAANLCEAMHEEDRPGDYAYAIRAAAPPQGEPK